MKLENLFGIWRHVHKSVITDFTVRKYDAERDKGKSFFSIYGRDENQKPVNYEWQAGIINVAQNDDGDWEIEIVKLRSTESGKEFEELTILAFEERNMTLRFSNGDVVDFKKT